MVDFSPTPATDSCSCSYIITKCAYKATLLTILYYDDSCPCCAVVCLQAKGMRPPSLKNNKDLKDLCSPGDFGPSGGVEICAQFFVSEIQLLQLSPGLPRSATPSTPTFSPYIERTSFTPYSYI